MTKRLTKPNKEPSLKTRVKFYKRFDKRMNLFILAISVTMAVFTLGFFYLSNKISSFGGERESLQQTIEEVRNKNHELEQEIQKKDQEIKTLNDKLTFMPQNLLELTNAKRLESGIRPLAINDKLNESAKLKAQDMINKSYWSHDSPDGSEPWMFFDKVKYPYSWAGENLAKGYTTGSEMVAGWMISPLHKENLLSTKYREVGFATIYIDTSTSVFGKQLTVAHYGRR